MNALKRWVAPAAALVAILALVVPAAASASKIEYSGVGGLLKKGTEMKVESNNINLATVWGDLTCSTIQYRETLSENTGSAFTMNQQGEGQSNVCYFKGTTPLFWHNLEFSGITSSKSGEAKVAQVGFAVDFPGLKCVWKGSGMPLTYGLGSNNFHVSKYQLTASPAACGSATLSGDFSVTAAGSKVLLY